MDMGGLSILCTLFRTVKENLNMINMSWFEDLFVKKTENWTYGSLTAEQIPEEPKAQEQITADEGYISIDICSLCIVNLRKFTSKFYGVVHSFIKLNHLSGEVASFQTVTTPPELKNIDPKRLDRLILANIPVLGPVPYRGGNMSVAIGLFSVKDSDLAGPYLDLLQDLATKAGISVVNAAIPFVETIKKGVDAIIGNSESSVLEIGISTSYSDPLITGWFVIMRAPKESNVISKVKVTEKDFKLVDAKTGDSIKDYPYVVFRVTKSRQRNDWYLLPDLKDSYSELQRAVRSKKYTDADELLKTFKRLALTSNDLLYEDGDRIGKLVEARTNATLKATQVSNTEEAELPELESYELYPNQVGQKK
jgi:hypothetical protein